jgi:hypothetical protein
MRLFRIASLARLVATTAMAGLTVLASCQDSTSPVSARDLALVGTTEGDPLTVLDTKSGAVLERPPSGVGMFGEDARTLSTHSPTLYYSGAGKLVSFDLTKRAVEWSEQLGAGQEARFGGQTIYANFALALSPDGRSLLLADSYYLGGWGVAVLDAASREARAFLDNLRVRRMITVQPGPLLPDGGVLALGTRAATMGNDDGERRRGQLYLMSGAPITIRDSIKFLSPVDSAAGGVVDIIVDGTGRYAYFTTYTRMLYRYDLLKRRYAGSVSLPAYGPVAISPDGSSVYVIDATQSRDLPGSGLMFAADSALNVAQTIDLNAAAREGLSPHLNSVIVSTDGLIAYVGAGTPSRGPTYGVQHGSVIAIDTRTRQIKETITLTTWGVRSVLPL